MQYTSHKIKLHKNMYLLNKSMLSKAFSKVNNPILSHSISKNKYGTTNNETT